MNVARLAAVALALFAVLALPAAGAAPADHSPNGISVTGAGTVETVPDRADFSFGVESQAATARRALSANAAEMRRVIAALKGAGVAAADIQTQFVSLSPRYTDEGQAIVGYTAHNSVSARLRDLDRAGTVIDAAVEAGATQVFGPSLTRGDSEALYEQALTRAYDKARAKAQALASKAGATLGQPLAIVEGGGAPVPLPAEAVAGGEVGVPIEPGTSKIQATVTVTFAIS